MNVLISSCFLMPTRYDGKIKSNDQIREVVKCLKEHKVNIIPICPEQLGGLTTPRPPAEIKSGKVFDNTGKDVTEQFSFGASAVVSLVQELEIDFVILKENSPSCGVHQINDGTFSSTRIPGEGITTKQLRSSGVLVLSENDLSEIKDLICKQKT